MAKNRKSAPKMEALMNDKNYIKSGRARNLPIAQCIINNDWEDAELAQIFVLREHVNGNFTVGCYLVDTACVGLKDTFFSFNIAPWEVDDIIRTVDESVGEMVPGDYNLVHNIIFGAIEFADEFGIPPHKDFELTRFILEEDDENVPLLDLDFGHDGVPVLVGDLSDPKTQYYLSLLKKNAGEGNYEFEPFAFDDGFDEDFDEAEDEDDPAEWEYEDWEVYINNRSAGIFAFPETATYFYKTILMPQDKTVLPLHGETDVLNFEITYEPLEYDYKLSDEEREEGELIFYKLQNNLSIKECSKLEKRLLDNIQKWPEARIFHNYLTLLYSKSGDEVKLDKVIKNITLLFPDYLYGKLALAERLIALGSLDEVPGLFNGEFSLKALYPERNVFHIGEMVSFHTLMCSYFMAKGDLFSAVMHSSLVFSFEIPEEVLLNWSVFEKLDIKVMDRVKSYLEQIREDENKVREIIFQLIGNQA